MALINKETIKGLKPCPCCGAELDKHSYNTSQGDYYRAMHIRMKYSPYCILKAVRIQSMEDVSQWELLTLAQPPKG